MSIATSTFSYAEVPPLERRASWGGQLLNGIYQTAVGAGAGYLAGYAFSIIDPVGGAIFGATSTFSSFAITFIAEKLGVSNTCAKILIWGLSFFASIGIAAFVTTSVGFPVTMLGGVGLTFAMMITRCVIGMITGGACCLSACIGGGILALTDRRV